MIKCYYSLCKGPQILAKKNWLFCFHEKWFSNMKQWCLKQYIHHRFPFAQKYFALSQTFAIRFIPEILIHDSTLNPIFKLWISLQKTGASFAFIIHLSLLRSFWFFDFCQILSFNVRLLQFIKSHFLAVNVQIKQTWKIN